MTSREIELIEKYLGSFRKDCFCKIVSNGEVISNFAIVWKLSENNESLQFIVEITNDLDLLNVVAFKGFIHSDTVKFFEEALEAVKEDLTIKGD